MTTTTWVDDGSFQPDLTKKQIIERLFKDGHITFNEMWTLLLDVPEVKYIPMPPQPPDFYPIPYFPPYTPNPNPNYPWTTCDTGKTELHNTGRGADSTP